jgi:hypothetical protein
VDSFYKGIELYPRFVGAYAALGKHHQVSDTRGATLQFALCRHTNMSREANPAPTRGFQAYPAPPRGFRSCSS